MSADYPARKANRLAGWDYAEPGVYFITLCTKNRRTLFCRIVGASFARPPEVLLSQAGKTVERELQKWAVCYPGVTIDKYVIMPNHLHLLLRIGESENGRAKLAPTVSRMVQQFKGAVSKSLGEGIWQKSFHDHIIRSERDYLELWHYMENNPAKWAEDRYYES